MVGLVIAPLLILVGLLLCLEGVGHGKMSEIFCVGPFLAVAGGLGWPRIGLTFSKAKPAVEARNAEIYDHSSVEVRSSSVPAKPR